MIWLAVACVAVAFLCALAQAGQPPARRPAALLVPIPRTWSQFLRSPYPLVAQEVPLRCRDGQEDVATVYNHVAALLVMRGGR